MFKVGNKVKIKDADFKIEDELLSKETLSVLESVNFTGTVTQIQNDLYYVGFIDEDSSWVTQVFEEDEIKEVK